MNDSGFVDHCLELLSPLGATRSHRMFGGHALYVDDLCIALVFRDALYLKVDDANRAAFEAARCQPFVYETKLGEHGSLRYFTAPEEAMESPHEMIPWARRALVAALAARAKAPPKKRAASKKVVAKKAGPDKVAARKIVAKKVAAKTPAPKTTAARKTPGLATPAARASAGIAKATPKTAAGRAGTATRARSTKP